MGLAGRHMACSVFKMPSVTYSLCDEITVTKSLCDEITGNRKNKGTSSTRSVVPIMLVLSALCVFSISFSAPCFGNQKQSICLLDDSQNYCTNPEPIAQILVYHVLCMLSQATTLIFNCLP